MNPAPPEAWKGLPIGTVCGPTIEEVIVKTPLLMLPRRLDIGIKWAGDVDVKKGNRHVWCWSVERSELLCEKLISCGVSRHAP